LERNSRSGVRRSSPMRLNFPVRKVEASYYSKILRLRKDRLGAFGEIFAFFYRFSVFSLKKETT
jgi:hypothetical protein